MLKIRLSRVGKRKQPSYRIVVTDSRNARAAHLEIIGHYNPLTNPATLNLKEDRAIHWLKVGAQPSDTAAKVLSRAGLMEQAGLTPVTWSGKQIAPGAKKQKAMAAAAAAAPAAAAPAPAPAAEGPAPAAEAPTPAEAPAAEEPTAAAPAEEPAAETPETEASE